MTAAVSAQNIYSTHLARVRRFEDKLAADAAASVTAVGATFVAPLRREKLAAMLRVESIEHSRPGIDECQHLARIFSRWSLSLKLNEHEGEEAFERAVSALAEDYPGVCPDQLSHEIRKALAASKAAAPSTMIHLQEFISRCKPGPLMLTRGTDDPMSRFSTPP